MTTFAIYKTFIGTEQEFNSFLEDIQVSMKMVVISAHKISKGFDGVDEYEVVFHKTPLGPQGGQ
jgi:hypothetical protein